MEDPINWRLRTPGGIPFRVVTRKGFFAYEDAQASEEYVIEADQLLNFVTEAFPAAIFSNNMFYRPQPPVLGGLGTLNPIRIAWEPFTEGLPIDPFGTDTGAPAGTYDPYIKVIVDFGPRPENDSEQDPNDPRTFLEVSADAGGHFLAPPIPSDAVWVLKDGVSRESVSELDVPFAITETLVEWSVRWPAIPYQYWNQTLMDKLRDSLGKINSQAMPLFQNAPVDTILFMSFSVREQYTWREGNTGRTPIELSMKFIEKNFESDGVQVTHQFLYRPAREDAGDGPGYRELIVDGNLKGLYDQDDLNGLWSPS
jgi:hypothetical protein